MDAVVFQHGREEGLELLDPALAEAGFTPILRYRSMEKTDRDAPLVVVLGGPMGVYEADRYPFLHDELDLLRHRLDRGLPNLGICLGAQLLAAAAGARVYPGSNGFELGIAPIKLTENALKDPVFARLPQTWETSHWHGDTFDDVPGAVLLATTSQYRQQAFRVGDSYGLQFHPELTARVLENWLTTSEHPAEHHRNAAKQTLPKLAEHLPLNATLLKQLADFFGAQTKR